MKKYQEFFIGSKRNILLIIAFSIVLLLFFVKIAFAATNYVSGDQVVLPKGETIRTDYFATGNTVVVSGIVNGDAYLAGGNVHVDGIINGDVIAAGGNITIAGRVTGNIRAVGGQIFVSGNVRENTTLVGGSLMIQDPARINGSLVTAGGNVSIFAPIEKGVTLAAGNGEINNSIGGDVVGAVGKLSVLPQATIAGNLEYWSEQQAEVSPDATIQGNRIFHQRIENPEEQQKKAFAFLSVTSLIWAFIQLLTAFIIGLLLWYLLPVYTQHIINTLSQRPWVSLGIGFLAAILFPIVFLVLLITILGIPLAFFLLAIFFLAAYLSKIFVGFAIGQRVLRRKTAWSLLLGLFIYEVIALLPFIGWIFSTIAFFIGLGGLILGKISYYTVLREKKII